MRKKAAPTPAAAYPSLPTARWVPVADLRKNPDNPRTIRDHAFEKLVTSLRTFPEMLRLRPIVVASWAEPVILGGNMRYEAAKVAGLHAVPVLAAEELTPAQRREFVIRDNVSGGEWDWDALANGWDAGELEAWGLELPMNIMNPDSLAEEFTLKDEEKANFINVTFHLAEEQNETIQKALVLARKAPEFHSLDKFQNENGNGNALYLIVTSWLALKN